MAERPIHIDTRNMLVSGVAFQYAHLIKFERPSRPDSASGKVSTSKERYTYISDASRDVVFDDGSKDLSNNPNGPQNYIANKVLKLSSVAEDTEAKATNYSLTLDGNGLGALASGQGSIDAVDAATWDITFGTDIDLIRLGFREGDKVQIGGLFFNIFKFRAPNIVRVTKIDSAPATLGSQIITMGLASDEIISVLLDKTGATYASFINREVYIYRAYLIDGQISGAPVLLFKGIISGVNFEDSEQSLTVVWSMTSHWGDFAQVRGRITSDEYHRALDQNGVPQPASALKVTYAYDRGFAHSDTSVHILAQYSVLVDKQDVTVHKGFLGIGSKVKVRNYKATEIRQTELDVQLQAKAIPVIYGVRTTKGIPVFTDTLVHDSSTVYSALALSEGEIGGIYDMYIGGNSLICNDLSDFTLRSTQTTTNTVQLICRGRADRGDVLSGTSSISATTSYKYY